MPEKALPMYPVYLYEEETELPESGTYYVVAKNGVYIHMERQIGSALVKVNGIPWLKNAVPSITLKLPKIPGRIIHQALTFFRRVWNEYSSEAYAQIYYSKELGQYRLWVPKQKVSNASVQYDRADQFNIKERAGGEVGKEIQEQWKWQMVGTIHSHCNFSAFHSGTDTHDEDSFDGIHITLGHVDRKEFSMCASVSVNANRVQLDPENCTSGVVRKTDEKITRSSFMIPGDVSYFTFELSEEDEKNLYEDEYVIDNEWMPKVQKHNIGFILKKDKESYDDWNSKDDWDWE